MLLKIMYDVQNTLDMMEFMEQMETKNGELSNKEKLKIHAILEKQRKEFNPENYKKNTENEDNFEKPNKFQARVIYKGINKPAVLWLTDKDGDEIEDTLGGEYEKILYMKNIVIYALKYRNEINLEPNFVMQGEDLIRRKVLVAEEERGKIRDMQYQNISKIKADIRETKVLFIDNEGRYER